MRLPAVDLDDETLSGHTKSRRGRRPCCVRGRGMRCRAHSRRKRSSSVRLRRRDVAQVGAKPRGGRRVSASRISPFVPRPAELRLPHRLLQPIVVEDMGEVDEGPGDGGDRDAAPVVRSSGESFMRWCSMPGGRRRATRRHGGKQTVAAQAPRARPRCGGTASPLQHASTAPPTSVLGLQSRARPRRRLDASGAAARCPAARRSGGASHPSQAAACRETMPYCGAANAAMSRSDLSRAPIWCPRQIWCDLRPPQAIRAAATAACP